MLCATQRHQVPDFKPNHDDSDLAAEYGREVLFEVIFIGNAVKVTAIDAETGVETSIIGPPTLTQYSMKANAMRKLAAVLAKLESDPDGCDPPPRRKPGWYV